MISRLGAPGYHEGFLHSPDVRALTAEARAFENEGGRSPGPAASNYFRNNFRGKDMGFNSGPYGRSRAAYAAPYNHHHHHPQHFGHAFQNPYMRGYHNNSYHHPPPQFGYNGGWDNHRQQPALDEKNYLVEQVKHSQRTNRKLWQSYIKHNNKNRSDPAFHSVEFLQGFLKKAEVQRAIHEGPAHYRPPMYERPPMNFNAAASEGNPAFERSRYIDLVKRTQRHDKRLWIVYLENRGRNRRDPSFYPTEFLLEFLKSDATKELEDVRSAIENPLPPIKQIQHEKLVHLVKKTQRFDRELWTAWIDSNGESTRDPAFHTPEFLLDYLKSSGVCDIDALIDHQFDIEKIEEELKAADTQLAEEKRQKEEGEKDTKKEETESEFIVANTQGESVVSQAVNKGSFLPDM